MGLMKATQTIFVLYIYIQNNISPLLQDSKDCVNHVITNCSYFLKLLTKNAAMGGEREGEAKMFD